ncbi:polyprenyl synthetase family protein [Allokutzneria sp. A3M-2-11 16]|uniref:polyprenyl synthetase family protein n=1 Tax=Allokutzneria sp. A3M-2-11 16 TaxID=2962043 RepID=UPI0020B8B75A|nr:polyprenyl synthetase family protein [Allokutzneria sp. A3M-2-11 16]MCP3799186.1 polyprenyl synthetase family protein [Allokutzneria sp. A3M-2-11 16]
MPPPDADLADMVVRECGRRWPQGATQPPGRLLRPMLVLESAMAVGGDPVRILPAAVGFECSHVGGLVHEEIIHRSGGPADALVAANALLFEWFRALSECVDRGVPPERVTEAMRIQASTGIDSCRGTELELASTLHSGLDGYLRMARLKTSAPLAAACRVGAVLSGASPAQTNALAEFGDALGLTCQIREDIRTYERNVEAVTRDGRGEVRVRRLSLPVLLAHDGANPRDRARIERLLTARSTPDRLPELVEIVRRTGACGTAMRMAEQYAAHARTVLTALPPSGHRVRLAGMTSTMNPVIPLRRQVDG